MEENGGKGEMGDGQGKGEQIEKLRALLSVSQLREMTL